MAKEWIMVRLGLDTHARLAPYKLKLMAACDRCTLRGDPLPEQPSLDFLIGRLLDQVEGHQARARGQRSRARDRRAGSRPA